MFKQFFLNFMLRLFLVWRNIQSLLFLIGKIIMKMIGVFFLQITEEPLSNNVVSFLLLIESRIKFENHNL
jgi:hypothetical protein